MVTDNELRTLLEQCRTIAVVGLSAEADRPSHVVAKYMQTHGFRVVPVNPRYAGLKPFRRNLGALHRHRLGKRHPYGKR